MRLGAIHTPPPAAVARLAARASLAAMTPPPRADWFARCPADGDALGNGSIGNCVPCAELRAIQTRRANAWSDAWKPREADAVALYTALTGYNPAIGMPDLGTDTAVAMTSWASTGITASDQAQDVVLWASVEPAEAAHIALAIAHTGPVQVTIALPLAAQDLASWNQPPGTGSAWQPASWGTHRVLVGAYDGLTRIARSWGQDVPIHPDFWAKYTLAVDATLSRQWLDTTGLSPAGLAWDALAADMRALAA